MNNKVLKFQSKIKSEGLLLAAEKRHKEIVEDLINAGEDINCSHCQTNYTVLHYASESGWLDIVKSLLAKGADIQVKTKYGDTPLILAAQYVRMDVFEFLLNAGADINYSNSNYTVLHYAIKYGWSKIVQILLKKGVDFEAKTKYGEPPLLLAAAQKQKRIVELLINAGGDINCFESYTKNNTLLHYAARNGWFKMVQFLLKKGTDIEVKYESGKSALVLAAERGHLDIFEFLLNAGADINLRKNKPNNNYTILHYASERGLFEIAQMLLKRGLDIEGNSSYTPPLVLAAKRGHKDIIELLVSAGADIHCFESNMGNTLFHYAAQWGWFGIIQFLLKKGTDIEIKNKSGMSPLFIAAKYGHRDIVELLLNAGADVNRTNGNISNFTVLHSVSRAERLDILQFLLQKGVNIEAKCSIGKTSLQMACEYSNFENVKHLINAGADVNVEDSCGTSPLSTIIENFCGIKLSNPYCIQILPNFKLVCSLFITSGAYLKSVDYERIMKHLYLKEYILQDIELSSQAIINEFNYKHLPELYTHSRACKILPRIEKMRIGNNSQVAHEVLQSVKHKMHVKGHCDVVGARPLVLNMLSVKSFLNYCENIKKHGSVSNQRKRSAELDYDNQNTKSSHKMMRLK